jgi:Uma2 family endonuclease
MATVLNPHPVEYAITSRTLADLLHELGDLPANRVRQFPAPGTVTFEQFATLLERSLPTCEWVDYTLVEKPVGQQESWLTFLIIAELGLYQKQHNPGLFLGPDGVLQILPGICRAPDISFISWSRLPSGKLPDEPIPALVPNLAIEVLSRTNTKREMIRKRQEYFSAGVQLVWEIDPVTRTVRVFTADDAGTLFGEDAILNGEPVLPGFQLALSELFSRVTHVTSGGNI